MGFLSAFYSSDHLDEVLILSNHLFVSVMDFLSAFYSSDYLDEVLVSSNHLLVLVMGFLLAFYGRGFMTIWQPLVVSFHHLLTIVPSFGLGSSTTNRP